MAKGTDTTNIDDTGTTEEIVKVDNVHAQPKGANVTKDYTYKNNTDNVQPEAPAASIVVFNTKILAIAAEVTDYSKQSLDKRLAFVEKLLGAKSLDSVIRIQSEYAKTAIESFVAESTKLGELYSDLAKLAFKPVKAAIANSQGTKP
jgi:hypothetical protein